MVTNNSWNSQDPAQVAKGGTGAATLTGVLTGNGTGAVTANAVTQYGIVIGGASNAVASTAVGTAAQVLTSNGAGVAPTFQAAAGGSNFVHIETISASNSASATFSTSIDSYTSLIAYFTSLGPNTDNQDIHLEFSTDAGVSWLITGYQAGLTYNAYNSTTFTNVNSTTAFIILDQGSSVKKGVGHVNISLKSAENSIDGSATWLKAGAVIESGQFGGSSTAAGVDALRFISASGNITGKIILFGRT